ncbi:right-handed parallel beta-helix repeat-containing protein [Clostridium nigeriense]|uniref:right-handed parallel beta-helix repeat-containing protein n=1 Tax=Clostridium nigeriense TaxID=1805470 RepID=UPI003D3305D8
MKGKTVKRLLAAVLSAAMVVTMFPAWDGSGVIVANAASIVTNENLFKYPTFEEDVPLEEHNDSNQNNKVGNWFYYQNTVKKEQGNAHTGEWAVSLGKTNDALEQDIPNLQKGATYKVSVWAKNTNPSNVRAYLCLKFYGGNEKKVVIDSTEYKKYEVEFIYTGDTSGKNTRTAIWVESGTNGNIYVDDWAFEISSNLKSLSVDNGSLKAEYKEDYTGEMKSTDFDISYTSSLEPDVAKKLDITEESVSGRTLTMKFDQIVAQPVEQNITVTSTYKPNNQPLIVDFKVDASGEEIVEDALTEISAENGTVTANIDKIPTIAPVKGDFTLEYKVNDGEFTPVEIKEFAYDKANKTVTLQFDKISAEVDAKNVTVKVTYKNVSKTDDFIVEIGSGIKYYVDASGGNDSNDGMSEATAWKTINKVNTVVFQPGDQILFKAGEEWTGALKPQGSGVDGAPIIIASYGEGKKPLLKPGEDWTISHMNIANKIVRSPRVNNVITFYNQQYWEVSDLELWDPTYEQNSNTNVYRRGINISAQDQGDLYYFKFDNLTIHGFRGPISNEGKSSGGVIMTVTTDLYDASKRIPTAVHDISITNCEMYNLGRSGVNFISPWTTREGEKWNEYKPFGYNGVGAWKPYENFHLSNNTIYNIDGDGAIIDGCKDAVVDHNTVHRAVYNCWFGVGLFNWNSDNVVFEYNEVYESSPADALLGAGDGQGIEIDALNQNTLVQYNYLHNNAGGVFMWCSTEDLRAFDGIYRYNISQNDGAKHGVIDWRPGHEGSMAYNNTIYLDDSVERTWMNNGYTGGKSDGKFYNNIVVNKGKMTVDSFNEQEIDYESNIFNGFDQVPSNDSTIIQEDPMLVAPGTGEKGIDSLEGYKLKSGSSAIDAGVNIENNGGKDYFGIALTDGKTDIGAAEYVASDKAELGETIKEAEEIDKTLYTDETIEILEESLAQAKEVFDNPDAKQDEIDVAIASLRAAIEGLVKKDDGIVIPPIPEKPEEPQKPTDPEKPQNTNGAQDTKPQASDEKEAVKTGDSSAAIPMAVLSLTALGIIIIVKKRRKFYN